MTPTLPPVPKPAPREPREPRLFTRRQRLARHALIRAANPERRAKLEAEQFGAHAELIRALPCAFCNPGSYRDAAQVRRTVEQHRGNAGLVRVSEAMHVRSCAAGGTSADLVPGCGTHHRTDRLSFHNLGRLGFAALHGSDLSTLARWITAAAQEV